MGGRRPQPLRLEGDLRAGRTGSKGLGLAIKAKLKVEPSQPLLQRYADQTFLDWMQNISDCLSGHCLGVASATPRHGECSGAEATRLGAREACRF